MTPDYRKTLKHVEPEEKEVKISEEDKEILKKHARENGENITPEQKTVLEIINKRKTVDMITREFNLALKPLGKELMTKKKILDNLNSLKRQKLVKSVTGADGQEYWVDVQYYREKLLGTDKL